MNVIIAVLFILALVASILIDDAAFRAVPIDFRRNHPMRLWPGGGIIVWLMWRRVK